MSRRSKIAALAVVIALNVGPVLAQICDEKLPITVENRSGTFVSMDDPFTVRSTYTKDGNFFGYIEDQGVITWRYIGTWKLSGNVQLSEYTYSSLPQIPAGTKDEDEIVSIGCGVLTYKSSLNGKTKRYMRVGD